MNQKNPTSVTISEEEAWRRGFEKIGVESLRLQLARTNITFPDPYIRCAHAWILEKEAEKFGVEAARFRKVLGWTIAGTVAAIIAAVASTVALFH